jgi:hypothetical protein
MLAYGADTFVDGKGQQHNWRNELAQKLIGLQNRTAAGPTANPTPGGRTGPSS